MIVASEYPQFLASLKATIRQRQYQALRAVNHARLLEVFHSAENNLIPDPAIE
jgi:hypothetical protein